MNAAARKGHGPAAFIGQAGKGLKLRQGGDNPVPRMEDRWGMLYVALTTIIMAYGGILGSVSILVFYAMWLPKMKYKGIWLLRPTADVLAMLPFPVLACLSFLWSMHPHLSMYKSFEYTSSILCAFIMARVVRTLPFMRGFIIGTFIVLVASLASGRYGMDPFSGKTSLVGLFGSKNIVGQFSELGLLFSILILLMRQSRLEHILYGIMPMGLFALTLYKSQSASSVLSLAMVLAMLVVLFIITRLPRIYRTFTFAVLGTWLMVVVVTGASLGWQNLILQSFGKSTTLTGRTLLWEKGIEAGQQRPALGVGYGAFWVHGNITAEHLWYKFGIANRSGFHFHNVFIQAFAELGGTGLAFLILLFLTVNLQTLRLVLKHGMKVDYCLAFGICLMMLIRGFVELDMMGTFGIGPILFYSQIPRLATLKKERQYQQAQGAAP